MLRFIGKRLVYAIITLFLIATCNIFSWLRGLRETQRSKVGQMPEQAQEFTEQIRIG